MHCRCVSDFTNERSGLFTDAFHKEWDEAPWQSPEFLTDRLAPPVCHLKASEQDLVLSRPSVLFSFTYSWCRRAPLPSLLPLLTGRREQDAELIMQRFAINHW